MNSNFDRNVFPTNKDHEYSILIPTWNNLPYLQNCILSIRSHSISEPQILVFVNEGNDGTLEWLRENKISFIHSRINVGICKAMNALRTLVLSPVICYLNDDMYVLPEWDRYILDEIANLKGHQYFLSSTMIEPINTGNSCVLVHDFGTSLEDFKSDSLLDKYRFFGKGDWNGSSWPPLFLSTRLWDEIGGFSEEFSPGMYSDPDMAMKAWKAGTRLFKGVGKSLVYHFGSRSTGRLSKNTGRKTFIQKWGMSSRFFYDIYLRMGSKFSGNLPEPNIRFWERILNYLKVLKANIAGK